MTENVPCLSKPGRSNADVPRGAGATSNVFSATTSPKTSHTVAVALLAPFGALSPQWIVKVGVRPYSNMPKSASGST